MSHPYSEEDPRPHECRWSGEGYIYCTASVRAKTPSTCEPCPSNPDTQGLLGFKHEKATR
jgi:hypothetical protein